MGGRSCSHPCHKISNNSLSIGGHHDLSISCLSAVKYEDVLGIHCPALENRRHRLQTIYFNDENNVISALDNLKELLKAKNIDQVHVFCDEHIEKLSDHLSENWIYRKNEKAAFNIEGCNFLLRNIRDEAYTIQTDLQMEFTNDLNNLYPHILVNIASEVSFIKVVSLTQYESIGKYNFNIPTLLNLYRKGEQSNLTQTIRLAKLFSCVRNSGGNDLNPLDTQETLTEDANVAYGLFNMFYNNIGQMCVLIAKMHGVRKILFRDEITNEILTKGILSDSIRNYSRNTLDAVFLRHENFMYGIGSILSCVSETGFEKSWYENYCESTGLSYQFCFFDGIETKQLTMDSLGECQIVSPLLLNPNTYCPDKQNLHTDVPAREYWIKCIKTGIKHGLDKQILETVNLQSKEGLQMYRDLVLERMDYLNSNPQSYGELTMRIIQDTLEHMKRETGLIAMYEKRKESENEAALSILEERLNYIDSLGFDERQEELIISMLAGNMFDWGAGEIAKLLQEGKFGFIQAKEKLPVRPWLVDDLDQWVQRTHGPPPRLAMIFCDNCGYDLILGIIPFVRYLLQRGTKVIICVNKFPVINDVTYYDMKKVLDKIKSICPIIKMSCDTNALSIMEISKSTCCLDLRCIDADIAAKMTEIDLLVIEGMGRAVHTNLDAEFNCETLRVGVVKDTWLSQQLGGDSFACICKHTL